jgi:adenylate kinase family enzyme
MESLGKRFETYMKDTMPIIKFYEAKGLVRKASTISSPEEVHVQISNFFKAANEKQDAGGH